MYPTPVKKLVDIIICEIDFCSKLDEDMQKFQELENLWTPVYDNLFLSSETVTYPYDNTEYHKVYLKGVRLENDEEFKERADKEAAWNAQFEERERKQFEALSKKFGDKK